MMNRSATLQQMPSIFDRPLEKSVTVSFPVRTAIGHAPRRVCPRELPLAGPIVDYEPAPVEARPVKPAPPAKRHLPPRAVSVREPALDAKSRDIQPPRAALVFADTALRRVLEVADRRRPCAQLRPLLTPALLDTVSALTRLPQPDGTAVLRRVRLRTAQHRDGLATAAEVFATFSRGPRLRAAAGRIEFVSGRWQLVALQLG
jgi:hypothetical protein